MKFTLPFCINSLILCVYISSSVGFTITPLLISLHYNLLIQGKALSSLCVEGLTTIVTIVCNHYPHKMAHFLHAANPDAEDDAETDGTDVQDTVHLHIKKFQVRVYTILVNSVQLRD